MPMAIIFARPLSCGPRKSVWGFTLLKMTMPSDSMAFLSQYSGMPSSSPYWTTSMEDKMGTPMLSSVTLYPASISSCPCAVAPAWLPIAGMMNGRAPHSLSTSHMVRSSWSK